MRAGRVAILAAVLSVVGATLAGCGFEAPAVIPPPHADPQAGCAFECHGDEISNAPPKSMSGATDTTSVAVGAHRAHLAVDPDWHREVACEDCHKVPATVDDPGHRDGDNRAEVTFSMISGPNATWSGTTCTTRCHGSTAIGGAQPAPTWTLVDGSQATCGSCHGRPPPAPHPNDTRCATCHPTMEEGSTTFRAPESHINGTIEAVAPGATGGCTSCHGAQDSAAPPKDLDGDTVPTPRGVGAHAAHLKTATWRRAIPCSSCHVVPLTVDAPGHRDGDNLAEVRFASLNPRAAYSAANARCTNLYCHGNGRDNNGTVSWITPGALGCNSCHRTDGTNMSGAHARHLQANIQCSQCHSLVVDANRNIINANLHVNGVHEVKLVTGAWDPARRRCQFNGGCHGTRDWEVGDGGGDDGGRGGPGGRR